MPTTAGQLGTGEGGRTGMVMTIGYERLDGTQVLLQRVVRQVDLLSVKCTNDVQPVKACVLAS